MLYSIGVAPLRCSRVGAPDASPSPPPSSADKIILPAAWCLAVIVVPRVMHPPVACPMVSLSAPQSRHWGVGASRHLWRLLPEGSVPVLAIRAVRRSAKLTVRVVLSMLFETFRRVGASCIHRR